MANPFLNKSEEELVHIVAENLDMIFRNNVTSEALGNRRVADKDVIVNAHLVDRAGAILNALCSLRYEWDAYDYYRDIDNSKRFMKS